MSDSMDVDFANKFYAHNRHYHHKSLASLSDLHTLSKAWKFYFKLCSSCHIASLGGV